MLLYAPVQLDLQRPLLLTGGASLLCKEPLGRGFTAAPTTRTGFNGDWGLIFSPVKICFCGRIAARKQYDGIQTTWWLLNRDQICDLHKGVLLVFLKDKHPAGEIYPVRPLDVPTTPA